ncbi:MAG: pyruvate dehydrogenase (acetyl-transferring) E1 component subunit alpha [Rickettsiaceae bacterium]|nr:pyruvate dehydrogenase (acetyl-transferring) E1 component subunit alpha [Rickettsiaceae bacterium]
MNITKHKITKDQYLKAYSDMLLIRRFEEKCAQFYGMGLISGFCHLYIGQEAVATGFNMAKRAGDSMITSYRDHAHIILCGMDPKFVLAELTGRATGCSKGKGGSMHMFDVENKFYGGHGIVGAQVPIGTGIAFAEKYKKTNNICYTFFGDGAVHQGQVYESFNMAKLWNLPVLYVLENNQYSMGTSVARCSSTADLYKRGESFGIPGYQVDGMNFEEVYNAAMNASEFVRGGNGPMLLELKTYRYRGHSMSDPAKYRTKEEVDLYKETKDPINHLADVIIKNKYADQNWIDATEKDIKKIVQDAAQFASDSELPCESELYTDIYHTEDAQ